MKQFVQREGKVWLVALISVVVYLTWNSSISETRIVRDLMGRTAFKDVRVLTAHAGYRDGLETLTLTGVLTKVRCDKIRHSVYTLHHDGVWRYASFRTLEGPDTPENRVASGEGEAWGPWEITALAPHPIAARMVTRHACPNRFLIEEYQDNEVFRVPWQEKRQ